MNVNFLIHSPLKAKDITLKNNQLTINSTDATITEYINAVTAVKVNGTNINGKNLGTTLFTETGAINFDASVTNRGTTTPFFANGINDNYTLYIEAAGYPSIEATVGTSVILKPVTVTEAYGSVKLSATSFVYNGKNRTPSVIAKTKNGKTISSKYYTVSYPKSRKAVGAYTVKVTFKGLYTGTATKTFTIAPAKTTVTLKSPTKNSLQVNWKKASGVTGYAIEYSTSKSFKNSKTVKAGASSLSKKLTKLTANKKYYVRVRSYKTVTVDSKKKTLYSSWSATKTLRTKKK